MVAAGAAEDVDAAATVVAGDVSDASLAALAGAGAEGWEATAGAGWLGLLKINQDPPTRMPMRIRHSPPIATKVWAGIGGFRLATRGGGGAPSAAGANGSLVRCFWAFLRASLMRLIRGGVGGLVGRWREDA